MESGKGVVWTSGAMYECTKSASPGYMVGEVYKCYENYRGHKCLMGRDGFEDLCSMLVSSFKRT
jgi:hypothetical protein